MHYMTRQHSTVNTWIMTHMLFCGELPLAHDDKHAMQNPLEMLRAQLV